MRSHRYSPLIGAAAGFLATLPMTIFMELAHRALPRRERYPLPPRAISKHTAEKAGFDEAAADPDALTATTVALHFGIGATAGAVYSKAAGRTKLPPAVEGAAFGALVWTSSYYLLLPALQLLSPASEHPPRRNALMLAANILWGAALGAGTAAMSGDRTGGS